VNAWFSTYLDIEINEVSVCVMQVMEEFGGGD